MSNRYLVTGGAGFIGSHIVRTLLADGEKVRVLDNFSSGKRENLADVLGEIELVEGDMRSYHIVQEAVDGVDVILHQAALPSVPRSVKDPITTNEVNVGGILNILEAARNARVRRVVYASSSSVYGNSEVLPKVETMQPNPQSPYAVTKLAGENYCKVFSHLYGLETTCLRYFNVFGARQDPASQYSAVIPKFITAMSKGKSPVIYGDGEQSRDFTYVENVVAANILAATFEYHPGLVMNVGCSERLSLNRLVKEINTILGKDVIPVYDKPRPGDVKHSLADISLIGSKLGFKPKIDFREGLKRTIESYVAG
ncbi:MAG: SDR family oxidoreductase [Bacteroidetes bacterium]|nr:SDR family oxidoreductase [Bacteroidota bacterium]